MNGTVCLNHDAVFNLFVTRLGTGEVAAYAVTTGVGSGNQIPCRTGLGRSPVASESRYAGSSPLSHIDQSASEAAARRAPTLSARPQHSVQFLHVQRPLQSVGCGSIALGCCSEI